MKKTILFIALIIASVSCLAMSSPPADNLVYSYGQYGNDWIYITRGQGLGWYSWHLADKGFSVKINSEYAISGTKEVNVYYQPEGYTSSVMDRYFLKDGSLYKVAHDYQVPVDIPVNRADWTAYMKTTEDFYNNWKQGKPPPPQKEIE